LANAEVVCHRLLVAWHGPSQNNLLWAQAPPAAPFDDAIDGIVFRVAQEKMIWLYAVCIVAGMTNVQIIRQFSAENAVAYPGS
jgi:hypothetical protein